MTFINADKDLSVANRLHLIYYEAVILANTLNKHSTEESLMNQVAQSVYQALKLVGHHKSEKIAGNKSIMFYLEETKQLIRTLRGSVRDEGMDAIVQNFEIVEQILFGEPLLLR